MSDNSLGFRRVDGIGQRSVNGALSSLLALTSDAVIIFGSDGRVILANEVAERSFASSSGALVGQDVREFFPSARGTGQGTDHGTDHGTGREEFSISALPFEVTGVAAPLVVRAAGGEAVSLVVRCERAASSGDIYVLVAHEDNGNQAAEHERDRLVGELSRANKRLSGTLSIVLATLDAEDVMALFSRVLEEITETMEATGTIFYVADSNGYHLRGTSESLEEVRVPRYMPFGRTLERLTTQVGHALRLRVLPPEGTDLRRGRLVWRDVVDEETREIYQVRSSMLPPFASFIAVPVWFGDHVIALIEVGWDQVCPTRREDAELLDAVAQYLSVQLVGAFTAFRAQREQRFQEVAGQIRERLMSAGSVEEGDVRLALGEAAKSLEATLLNARPVDDLGRRIEVYLPKDGRRVLDLTETGEDLSSREPRVIALDGDSGLGAALYDGGVPAVGALVDVGEIDGNRLLFLVLRKEEVEPFDDIELAFLGRVAEGASGLARGGEERRQDKHIAQALQTGMRNELQRVPGIEAVGIYSSATQEAVIGGDFYDLIRLPDERACVIMGDVSGKGVEAASVSAAVKTALGAYSWQGLAPSEMVRLLNEFLMGFSRLETFATLFVGVIDVKESLVTYCSAGHPPAVLVRARTGEIETLGVQSAVVGAFHDVTYRDGQIRVSEGDMLLLYTDGTTESRARDGSFFGEDGLRDAIMREWPKGFDGILDRLLETLDVFTGRHLEDDVAMVALRFAGSADGDKPAGKGKLSA
ncbi:MAG: SpoIIE family protein phosphatase [Olsenella sp.]|nr:SpoIIE family protein phosphatase [Olsenella sp.]